MTATHESRREGGRYSLVSITLHWTIAALIVTQIPLGWRMSDLPFGSAKFELFQLHKSIGITILALSLVRLGWRLTHPAPPLPDHMGRWEKILARATHVGFYVVMIATPLGRLGAGVGELSEHPDPDLGRDPPAPPAGVRGHGARAAGGDQRPGVLGPQRAGLVRGGPAGACTSPAP
jgi:hypothetical protein